MDIQPFHRVPATDDGPELSPNSSSNNTTRLTPDSGSDGSGDEEDLDLDLEELGEGESYKMQRRGRGDAEKGLLRDRDGEDEDGDDEQEFSGGRMRRRRASVSTVQSYQLYTPDEERAVVKKFDRRLVLFVALLYMLSFLDRSSTGPIISHYLLRRAD